jgi:LCP family protein required for cell wall assembly
MSTIPPVDADSDDLLAKQLEKLFSDAVPRGLHATPGQQVAKPRKETTPLPTRPSIAKGTEFTRPRSQLERSRFPRSRWIAGWLSTLTVLVLLLTVLLLKQTGRAQSGAVPTSPARTVIAVAQEIPSTATPEPFAGASVTRTPSVVTHTPTSSTTSATPISGERTHTPTISPIPNTASPTPTPTLIPATATPTVDPATPTLAPANHAYPATITPAPAQVMGLDTVPTPVPLVPMSDKAINIVLLGSDQRPYETSWRTDVVIVVSVNPDLPSVSMLSIPRDTWLYIPNWTYQRINLADTHGAAVGYPGGGPGLVKATIEYNFGIHVDYYARVDFAGLMRIVDTLGGVDILLDCPVADGFPDDPITEDPSVVTQIDYPVPGLYHLDGKHALWLARSRKTTSEFARSRRQHRILQGIWATANELGFITRLPELWEELTTTVRTDLSLDDVLWLASIGLRLEPSQIQSGFIDGRYLTAWVTPGGANVLLPHTAAILEALEPLFNPYPFKAPQGFSQIEVWNGSGHENWGLLAADRLARNGFVIADIRTADELYEASEIIDFTTTTKGSPLPLLQSLFNANVTQVTRESGAESRNAASFRLIVGNDYQPCEWPAAARWEPTPTPSTTLEN